MCGVAHGCGHVCMCLWKPEINLKRHSSVAWSFPSRLGQLGRNLHAPVCSFVVPGSQACASMVPGSQMWASVVLESQVCAAVHGYSMCNLVMNSDFHDYLISTSLTEQSSQAPDIFQSWLIFLFRKTISIDNSIPHKSVEQNTKSIVRALSETDENSILIPNQSSFNDFSWNSV